MTDEPQYEDSLLKRHIKVTKKDDTRNPVFYREESVQIIEPKLSKLINAFLTTKNKDEDRTMLLDYIFGDKVLEDYEYNTLSGFERRRDEILSAMRVIIEDGRLEECQEFVSFREKLDELETIQEDIKINKSIDIQKQRDYIPAIKEAITLTKVDQIDYDSYIKVMKFNGQKPLC